MSASVIARGAFVKSPPKGMALGAIVSQPPCAPVKCAPPSHGSAADALRPACAIWMPATAPRSFTNAAMRASGSMCLSDHKPRQPGVMRPSGDTAVASTMTSPAPPTAREPRWTKCQSFARPSSAEYWHMGETPMRLRNVTERTASGENKCGTEGKFLSITRTNYAGNVKVKAVRRCIRLRPASAPFILRVWRSKPRACPANLASGRRCRSGFLRWRRPSVPAEKPWFR